MKGCTGDRYSYLVQMIDKSAIFIALWLGVRHFLFGVLWLVHRRHLSVILLEAMWKLVQDIDLMAEFQ